MKDSLFHNHRKTIASAIYTNRLFHILLLLLQSRHFYSSSDYCITF